MSFNGSGLFAINSVGQPVVFNTTIDETVFNAFTADIATGLSTCITKDGQTTVTGNIPMGGYKFTNLGLGTAVTDAARVDNANSSINEFRLTLTTGVPVTSSDVTGASAETVYWTPFKGNHVSLFDGTSWHMRTSAELSIDVPDATNCYDVFIYDNAGVATIELTAWTNQTTRATALVYQDGVLSKNGALTRRYVGSFYCSTAGNGQTEDSYMNRLLFNYYNQVPRPMRQTEGTDTWNYSSSTIRQVNGSAANQLSVCIGVNEQAVTVWAVSCAKSNTAADTVATGIGLDSTSTYATGGVHAPISCPVSGYYVNPTGALTTFPGVGLHVFSWNESCPGITGTVTWIGDNGSIASGAYQTGIFGEILA